MEVMLILLWCTSCFVRGLAPALVVFGITALEQHLVVSAWNGHHTFDTAIKHKGVKVTMQILL